MHLKISVGQHYYLVKFNRFEQEKCYFLSNEWLLPKKETDRVKEILAAKWSITLKCHTLEYCVTKRAEDLDPVKLHSSMDDFH